MKTAVIISTALLALAAIAPAQKISIKPAPKAGDTGTYKFEMKISVQGMDVIVSGNQVRKVSKVEADTINWTANFESLKADIGGAEQEIPTTPIKISQKTTGDVLKVEGGIDQLDSVRSLLMLRFVAPTTDVAAGDTYKIEFKAVKDGQPAHTYAGKYEGPEKVGDKDAFKFTSVYTEAGKDTFATRNTYWVTADGTILKCVSKFDNYDIPPAGGPQTGQVTLTLVK